MQLIPFLVLGHLAFDSEEKQKNPLVVEGKLIKVFISNLYQLLRTASASDPYILTDFIVPEDQTGETIDGNFFTFTGMHGSFGSIITNFKVTKANKAEFPALHGQSTSLAVFSSMVRVSTHPRAAELLFVVQGNLQVGLRDTNAGTVSLPTTLFATGVDDQILAKSFKTDLATVQKIKAGLILGSHCCSANF
uniref:Germin-like protein 9-3 n=1 Tax=Nicotiana tabacum TaxID=4097 RepID=A0A1S4C1K5_TOBAC|nr:PREDICTED: germin-like protein 9-3 [Nicotiana tabacum]